MSAAIFGAGTSATPTVLRHDTEEVVSLQNNIIWTKSSVDGDRSADSSCVCPKHSRRRRGLGRRRGSLSKAPSRRKRQEESRGGLSLAPRSAGAGDPQAIEKGQLAVKMIALVFCASTVIIASEARADKSPYVRYTI